MMQNQRGVPLRAWFTAAGTGCCKWHCPLAPSCEGSFKEVIVGASWRLQLDSSTELALVPTILAVTCFWGGSGWLHTLSRVGIVVDLYHCNPHAGRLSAAVGPVPQVTFVETFQSGLNQVRCSVFQYSEEHSDLTTYILVRIFESDLWHWVPLFLGAQLEILEGFWFSEGGYSIICKIQVSWKCLKMYG